MKTDKSLWISDVHMSNSLPQAIPVERNETDRIQDQMALWAHVREVAEIEQVKRIHIVGDLTDKGRPDAVTLALTCRALKQLSEVAPVYIMGGNHDALSVNGERYTTEFLRELQVPRIHFVMEPKDFETEKWIRFWPVHYMPLDETREAIEAIRLRMAKDRRPCEVLLLHQSILGCSHEGWKCDMGLTPEEARQSFDFTLSGHFHTAQYFGDDKRGLYFGSPLHFRFDDAKRGAGFWIITFQKRAGLITNGLTWNPVFIKSKTPRFREVLWPQKCREAKKGDYLRISVNATHAEYVQLKPAAEAYRDAMIAKGVRAQVHFSPVYHHTKRLENAKGNGGKVSIGAVIDEYVKALDVDTNGLESKRLREIGRQAIEAQASRTKGER